MTKSVKRALKSVGIPAVRWNEQYGQFFCRIGYRKSRSSTRQRTYI